MEVALAEVAFVVIGARLFKPCATLVEAILIAEEKRAYRIEPMTMRIARD